MSKDINIHSEVKKLKSLHNDSQKVISHLLSLQVELPYESNQLIDLIKELHNNQNIDIVQCCKESLEQGLDVFRVADLLKKSIVKFEKIDTNFLVDALELFAEKMKGDMASGLFHSAIEELGKQDKETSINLEQEIISRSNEQILGYLIALYIGIS